MDLHTGTSPRGVKKLKAVEKAGIVSRSGVTNYVRRLKLVHNCAASWLSRKRTAGGDLRDLWIRRGRTRNNVLPG